MELVEFATEDETLLTGQLIEHGNPEGMTVIHGATGVPYLYYEPFAKWLSEAKSHHVLIYAYRDSNQPSAAQLRRSKTRMSDWGLLDQPAALEFMLDRFPKLPLHTVGHSLGGFCIPFHEKADRIVSHTAVNSGLAYWRDHPRHYMAQVMLFWFVLGPLSTLILGYMPGRLLGMKDGIPAGVFWQWRKWCTNEAFHAIEWGRGLPVPDLKKFAGQLKLVSCSDDVMIPTSRVKALSRFYPHARNTDALELEPGAFGLSHIGHIQVFSKKCASVWPAITA